MRYTTIMCDRMIELTLTNEPDLFISACTAMCTGDYTY
jgi:hypothetical protein